MRTIAVVGCRIAALVILAAVILWVVRPPLNTPDTSHQFCRSPIEAVTTLWDRSYLRAPSDEMCTVFVGARTIAAGMAAGGVIAMAILSVPLWLPRRPDRRLGQTKAPAAG